LVVLRLLLLDFWVLNPILKIEFSGLSGLIKMLLKLLTIVKLRLGVYVAFTMGISFYRFPKSIEPPYFTKLTFIRYLVMMRLFDLHPIIQPLILVKPDPVLALNHPLLTILTSKTPLDPFKRNKFPFEHLLLLRTPLFGLCLRAPQRASWDAC